MSLLFSFIFPSCGGCKSMSDVSHEFCHGLCVILFVPSVLPSAVPSRFPIFLGNLAFFFPDISSFGPISGWHFFHCCGPTWGGHRSTTIAPVHLGISFWHFFVIFPSCGGRVSVSDEFCHFLFAIFVSSICQTCGGHQSIYDFWWAIRQFFC